MTEQLQRFKELYISLVIEQGLAMDDEMLALFEELLAGEFDDNPEKMDELIAEIIAENSLQEPTLEDTVKNLQTENAMLKGSVMELSSYLLNRMGGE